MRHAVLLVVVCLVAASCAAPERKHHHRQKDSLDVNGDSEPVKFQSAAEFDQKWIQFKSTHEKSYEGTEEEEKRKKIFFANLKEIDEHNELYDKGMETYKKGLNQFGDLTNAEFLALVTCLPQTNLTTLFANHSEPPAELFPDSVLPDAVDWRSRGVVTRVKNQGDCGSCWSFAAVGALESQMYLKTREVVYLSEQNVVDCCRSNYGNYGCRGGYPHMAFVYIKRNGGIDTEESYQYEAEDGRCRYDSRLKGGHVDEVVLLPSGSEAFLQRAIAYVGPVVVGIDASGLQFYYSGIYYSRSRSLNHAVLAVGYKSSSPGRDYWIYKNSWGVQWGMDGYGLLARNRDNAAGIGYYSTYPRVY